MPICEGCGQEGRATDRDFEWMGSQEDQYFRDPHTALRLYGFPTGCRPRDPALYPPLREYVLPPFMGPVITVIQHLTSLRSPSVVDLPKVAPGSKAS